jgi:hypothetical protein
LKRENKLGYERPSNTRKKFSEVQIKKKVRSSFKVPENLINA